jgi:hypothetical protein
MDVLKRLPVGELDLIVEALGARSPDNPAWQLWTAVSARTSFELLPDKYREKTVSLLDDSIKELLGRVPPWVAVLFSLLVKVHPWLHGGLYGCALRRAFHRCLADAKKRKREQVKAVLRRKKAGESLGQIARSLHISREAAKGIWKRHKPGPT